MTLLEAQEQFFEIIKNGDNEKARKYKRILERHAQDAMPNEDGVPAVDEESLRDDIVDDIFSDIVNDFMADAESEANELAKEQDWTAEDEYKRAISG